MAVPESRRGLPGLQLVAGLALGVLVGFLIWGGRGGEERRRARSTPEAEPEAAVAELRRKLELRDEAFEALSRRAAEMEAELGERRPVPDGSDEARPAGPRFVYAGHEGKLRAVDWDACGDALAKLNPLLVDIAGKVEAGEELAPEDWGELFQHLGPLITAGLVLEKDKPEHTRDAGSHPAALVNFVEATLRQAGLPLTERQAAELDAIGLRYIEEDRRRRAAYGPETVEMRMMLEESALQDRVYADLRSMLDDAQRAAMYPERTRGRFRADLWTGTHIWDEHFHVVRYKSREELVRSVTKMYEDRLGLSEASKSVLAGLMGEWSEGMGDAFLAETVDPLSQAEMPTNARVYHMARLQVKLHEALIAQAPLTPEQKAGLIAADRLLIPVRRKE